MTDISNDHFHRDCNSAPPTNWRACFPTGPASEPVTAPMRKVRRDWKGCEWPSPVFVARFACGRHMAIGWWTKKGKPVDIDGARASFEAIYRSKYGPDPEIVVDYVRGPIDGEAMDYERNEQTKHLAAYAEMQGYRHICDYADSPPPITTPAVAKCPPGRKVAAVLAELLAYLEGDSDDHDILETARKVAAFAN